jgi:ubiquitin carboxyl-terminal hydrolase L5
LLTRHI